MGDTTIYLLLDFTLLGRRGDAATTPISLSSSAASSSSSVEPSFQFESISQVLSADSSLSELMSIILSQIILASPQSSQDTKKWSADKLTILDISRHPAKVVSAIFHQFTDASGPNSKTLNSLGWHSSGKLVVLPSPSSSSSDDNREKNLLDRFLESSTAQSKVAAKPPETDAKARNKRQRLLLLHHASKCTAEHGQCKVSAHCTKMKDVWKHIAQCNDSYCKVLYCMSSRYLLSHYKRCKPPCHICDPVKKIIHGGSSRVSKALGEGEQSMPPSLPPAVEDHLPQPKRQKTEHPPSSMMPPQSSSVPNEADDRPTPRSDAPVSAPPPSSGDDASDQASSKHQLSSQPN